MAGASLSVGVALSLAPALAWWTVFCLVRFESSLDETTGPSCWVSGPSLGPPPVSRGLGDGSQLCGPRGRTWGQTCPGTGACKPWMGKAWRASPGAGWHRAPKGVLCRCPKASVSLPPSPPLLPSGLCHDQERLFLSPEEPHCWLTLLCPVSQGQGLGEPSPAHRFSPCYRLLRHPVRADPSEAVWGVRGAEPARLPLASQTLRAKPCSQASQSPALPLSCSDQRGVV